MHMFLFKLMKSQPTDDEFLIVVFIMNAVMKYDGLK